MDWGVSLEGSGSYDEWYAGVEAESGPFDSTGWDFFSTVPLLTPFDCPLGVISGHASHRPSYDAAGSDAEDSAPEGIPLREIAPAGIQLREIAPEGIALREIAPEGIPLREIAPMAVDEDRVVEVPSATSNRVYRVETRLGEVESPLLRKLRAALQGQAPMLASNDEWSTTSS